MDQGVLRDLIQSLEWVNHADDSRFGPLLLRSMQLLNIDDETIAHRFDVSRPSVFRWKNGKNAPHPKMRQYIYSFLLETARSKLNSELKPRGLGWWSRHIVHNVVAHPLLVVAELAGTCRVNTVQQLLYSFHDITVPDDDIKNKLMLLEKKT